MTSDERSPSVWVARLRGTRSPIEAATLIHTGLTQGALDPHEIPAETAEYLRSIATEAESYILRLYGPEARVQVRTFFNALASDDLSVLHLEPDERVVFLVGAGASAPPPASIPTVANLLEELWNRAARVDQEPLNRLKDWCVQNRITNIEHLLTAAFMADMSVSQPPLSDLIGFFLFGQGASSEFGRRQRQITTNAAAVAQIHGTLDGLFGLLMGTMVGAEANEAHKAIAYLASRHEQTAVITTNYDACIDLALRDANLSPTYGIENWPAPSVIAGTHLIKVHGSVNWSFCDSCQEVRIFDIQAVRDAYLNDSLSYAVVGICRHCGGQRKPMIVPPLALKLPMYSPLFSLWEEARRTLAAADLILVVGYAFADADSYLTRMLELAVSQRPSAKIVVLDQDPGVADRLRHRFEAHVRGFTRDRVLLAQGDCSKRLPEIVQHLTSEVLITPPQPVTRADRSSQSRLRTTAASAAQALRTNTPAAPAEPVPPLP